MCQVLDAGQTPCCRLATNCVSAVSRERRHPGERDAVSVELRVQRGLLRPCWRKLHGMRSRSRPQSGFLDPSLRAHLTLFMSRELHACQRLQQHGMHALRRQHVRQRWRRVAAPRERGYLHRRACEPLLVPPRRHVRSDLLRPRFAFGLWAVLLIAFACDNDAYHEQATTYPLRSPLGTPGKYCFPQSYTTLHSARPARLGVCRLGRQLYVRKTRNLSRH